MSHEKTDRLDRLEQIVSEYIEESRDERKEMRQHMRLLSNAMLELTNLQLQYHRDALNPVPTPSNGD